MLRFALATFCACALVAQPAAADEQEQREEAQPRPPLPEVESPPSPRWDRNIQVGGHAAYVLRPFANGVVESPIRYEPAIGWGIHVRWALLDWLELHPYFHDAHHDLVIPIGALATGSANGFGRGSTVAETTVTSFVFGVRLAPTLRLGEHARGWLSAGIGWGRMQFPPMLVSESNGALFEVAEREGVFVEIPLGLGIAYEVWPDWLTIEFEASGAPVIEQSGSAHESFQTIDPNGNLRDVGPFGAIEASFVQTLGLSFLL